MSDFFTQSYLHELIDPFFKLKKTGEHWLIGLSAENTQFTRIGGVAGGTKIRQTGTVEDASLQVELIIESNNWLRKISASLTLSGIKNHDSARLLDLATALRAECAELPPDPYASLPGEGLISHSITEGQLLSPDESASTLLKPLNDLDVSGIYASGAVARAMVSSHGHDHWFLTKTFTFDYSIYTKSQRALKHTFAGSEWSTARYVSEIERARTRLAVLERQPRPLARGGYRVYLAPAAVDCLMAMLSWGSLSETAIRRGESPLRLLRSQTHSLSPIFSLSEDFRQATRPRFNNRGELAPEVLPLIREGQLVNTLISARSAKEYGLISNGAASEEQTRSLSVAPGTLASSDIITALDTGIYISNLHYLNWSDMFGGRITGMTRYACFWVENGKLVAPIENLRFDDSLFNLFGPELENISDQATFIPVVDTYGMRSLGGSKVPGMLIERMEFTL